MKSRKSVFLTTVLMLFSLFLLAPCAMHAQATGTAKVTGTVTDPSGATVLDAEVVLLLKATNVRRTQQTNASGQYIFVDVEPGVYAVTVAKAGFNTAVIESLRVEVAKSHLIDVTLKLGTVGELVQVTAGATVDLQTTDATVGNVIGGDALLYLPNQNRDATSLLQLQPLVSSGRGVDQDHGGGVAGARTDQSTFILDGGDATEDAEGTGAYTTSYSGQVIAAIPTPADSVEEFRVGTNNPNANFGRSAGGQVYLVSKRGTNTLHGSAYWYHQNSALNANTWDRNSVGAPKPSNHQNRFGASAGGPIIKDKIFIFGMYEAWRFPHSLDISRLVPTDTLRAGTLRFSDAAGNIVSYNLATSTQCGLTGNAACDPRGLGISPVIQSIWNLLPTGNDAAQGDGLNTIGFRAPAAIRFNSDFAMARADYIINQKWNLFGTFRFYRQVSGDPLQIDISGVVSKRPGQAVAVATLPNQPRYAALGLVGQITPHLINTFNLSWLRYWWAFQRVEPFPLVPGTDAALDIDGVDQPIDISTANSRNHTWSSRIWLLRDDISWVRGKHIVSFGGNLRHDNNLHLRDDTGRARTAFIAQIGPGDGAFIPPANEPIPCGGNVAANCLNPADLRRWDVLYAATLGIVNSSAITRVFDSHFNPLAAGTPISINSTMDAFELYATDTWRMTSTLSLTAGLNYAVQFPPTEATGKQTLQVYPNGQLVTAANYFAQLQQAEKAGTYFAPLIGWVPIRTTGRKYPYNVDWKDLGPRLSAAWNPSFKAGILQRLFGDRKTVVRGGYAFTFERMNAINPVVNEATIPGFQQSLSCLGPGRNGVCQGFNGSIPGTAFRVGQDGSNVPVQSLSPIQLPIIPGSNAPIEPFLEVNDPALKVARSQGFDLTLQRELPGNMILEVGYVGRHMSHLTQTTDFGQVPIFMKDNKSGQTFAQAFDAVATAIRKSTPVTPQPWFEDLTGPGSTLALASNFSTQFQQGFVHDLWTSGIQPLLPQLAINEQVLTYQVMVDTGRANYNAGFIALHKRNTHGLTFDANYTLSHSLDQIGYTQENDVSPTNSINLNYDYGPALSDRRHIFNSLLLYELPLGRGHRIATGNWADKAMEGWFLSGIFAAASGSPLAVIQGACQEFGSTPGGNCVNAIPLKDTGSFDKGVHYGVTGSGGVGTSGNINMFRDPQAVFNSFRPVLISQDTTSGGGGILRGLPRWNLDFAVGKKIRFGESVALTITADFFNVLNHVEFADPTLDLTNPATFGVLNSSFGVRAVDQSAARAVQIGLRVTF